MIFLGMALPASQKAPPKLPPSMSLFTGTRMRFSTAPSGSAMMSAALDALSETQSQALFAPDLREPQIPPSANARCAPASPPGMGRPRRAAQFIAATMRGPPTARVHSGRMMASPPDRAREPPPSGDTK